MINNINLNQFFFLKHLSLRRSNLLRLANNTFKLVWKFRYIRINRKSRITECAFKHRERSQRSLKLVPVTEGFNQTWRSNLNKQKRK